MVLDSSCWIELLRSGPLSESCGKELARAKTVIVPTLVLYEVYKKVAKQAGEDRGLSVVAMLSQYQVADLTRDVSLLAADLSLQNQLAMADSIVLAHAQAALATLITLDNDFAGIKGVRILRA